MSELEVFDLGSQVDLPGEQTLNLLSLTPTGSNQQDKKDVDVSGQSSGAGKDSGSNQNSHEGQNPDNQGSDEGVQDNSASQVNADQSDPIDSSENTAAQQNDSTASGEVHVEVPIIETNVVSEHYDLQEKINILQRVFGDKCPKIAELQNKFADDYLPEAGIPLSAIQKICTDKGYAESLGINQSELDKYKKDLANYVLPEIKKAANIQESNGDYISLAKSLHQVEIVKSITGEPFSEKPEELQFKAQEARIKGDLQTLLRSDDTDAPSLIANLTELENLYRGHNDTNKADSLRNFINTKRDFINKLSGVDGQLSQEDTLKLKLDVCEFQFGKLSFESANQLTKLSLFYRKEKNDVQANYCINQASPIYDSVLKQYPSSIPKDFVPEYMSALNSYAQFLVADEGTEEVTADDGKIHQINRAASAALLKATFLGQEIPSITAVEDAAASANQQELSHKLADLADVYTLYGDDSDVQKTIDLYEYAMQHELSLQANGGDPQSLSQYMRQVLEKRYKGYKETVLGDR